jgi:hypothetical protein
MGHRSRVGDRASRNLRRGRCSPSRRPATADHFVSISCSFCGSLYAFRSTPRPQRRSTGRKTATNAISVHPCSSVVPRSRSRGGASVRSVQQSCRENHRWTQMNTEPAARPRTPRGTLTGQWIPYGLGREPHNGHKMTEKWAARAGSAMRTRETSRASVAGRLGARRPPTILCPSCVHFVVPHTPSTRPGGHSGAPRAGRPPRTRSVFICVHPWFPKHCVCRHRPGTWFRRRVARRDCLIALSAGSGACR